MGDLQLKRFFDKKLALELYRRYLACLPEDQSGDPMVYFNLAALLSEENPRLAIDYYLKARDGGTHAALVDRSLGYLYAEIEEWEKSLDAFTQYLEQPPDGDEAERAAASSFVKKNVLPRIVEPAPRK
jgi:tetratricopeptide (TPR) repeat protein